MAQNPEILSAQNLGGQGPGSGFLPRISRYGIGGYILVPSSPISGRARGGRADMMATPRRNTSEHAQAIRRAVEGHQIALTREDVRFEGGDPTLPYPPRPSRWGHFANRR